MRLLVCAGGTGGGVYPALAVVNRLLREHPDAQILWVGREGGMEARLINRVGVAFRTLPAAGIHGVGLRRLPGNIHQLGRGYFASRHLLHDFQPDLLFFTGGYLAAPVALAGLRIPTLLFVPDIEPGMALKFLSQFADCIAITVEESRRFFPAKKRVVVTGYPTRAELSSWQKDAAYRVFGFSPTMPTLLVTGGSLGALSINQALVPALPDLLEDMQVIHLTGERTWPQFEKVRETLPPELAPRYRAYPYLHEEMGAAFTIADLVISRAGASSLGEYPHFGIPAILVPYPYAWRYQKVNAEFLESRGAAVQVPDDELTDVILPLVRDIMQDVERRRRMQAAMRALRKPQPEAAIVSLIREMTQTGVGKEKGDD